MCSNILRCESCEVAVSRARTPGPRVRYPRMGEDLTRGPTADQSGWVTTKVAAQALRVDPRTVRKYIKQGKLDAKAEGEGVEKTYLVSIDSVYALRGRAADRIDPREGRESSPREAAGAAVSEDLVDLVRDLTADVSRRASEAAELRTRLELTAEAESSKREALEQRLETERIRREQAEKERDELAARLTELESAPEVREGDPETLASASIEEGQGVEAPLRQEQRPWRERSKGVWRRLFGG